MVTEPQTETIPPDFMAIMADKLGVLAHPHRLRIIEILDTTDQANVGEIQDLLGLPQTTVSNHLTTMHRAGLLTKHREGRHVHYHIANMNCLVILDCIRKNYRLMKEAAGTSFTQ